MTKIKQVFERIDWKAIPSATYARYFLMVLTILNMVLTHAGLNPIDVDDSDVYQIASDILSAVILITNTWFNNSVTKEAIEADEIMHDKIEKTLEELEEQVDESDAAG